MTMSLVIGTNHEPDFGRLSWRQDERWVARQIMRNQRVPSSTCVLSCMRSLILNDLQTHNHQLQVHIQVIHPSKSRPTLLSLRE